MTLIHSSVCDMMRAHIDDALVLIDDGYLSEISKHFGGGKHIPIHYKTFAIELAKEAGLWCKEIIFYTAPPYQSPEPTSAEAEMKRKHDIFVASIRKGGIKVREGRCQKTEDDFRQKGVDSLIVRDLCLLPDGIKNVILVTADTDFAPIIKELNGKGIRTTLFYYSDFQRRSKFAMLSNYLLEVAYKTQMLRKEHFENARIKK